MLSHWIKCGRKYDAQPSMDDYLKFSETWKAWWFELQPSSRKVGNRYEELTKTVEPGEEWVELRKGSANGFFSIVLALSWWVKAETRDDRHELNNAVGDVLWVLERMIAAMPKVRKSVDDSTEEAQSRKR
jgi:hypothetical protein